MSRIEKDVLIEELVKNYPRAIKFLMSWGIECIACGEPIWGTLAEEAKKQGLTEEEATHLISELNHFLFSEQKKPDENL